MQSHLRIQYRLMWNLYKFYSVVYTFHIFLYILHLSLFFWKIHLCSFSSYREMSSYNNLLDNLYKYLHHLWQIPLYNWHIHYHFYTQDSFHHLIHIVDTYDSTEYDSWDKSNSFNFHCSLSPFYIHQLRDYSLLHTSNIYLLCNLHKGIHNLLPLLSQTFHGHIFLK